MVSENPYKGSMTGAALALGLAFVVCACGATTEHVASMDTNQKKMVEQAQDMNANQQKLVQEGQDMNASLKKVQETTDKLATQIERMADALSKLENLSQEAVKTILAQMFKPQSAPKTPDIGDVTP